MADQGDGGGIAVDEEDVASAPADGFDSDGAGAGVEIDEEGIGDGWAEDVEERFAEAVAGGADGLGAGSFQATAAIFSGDYAHESPRSFVGNLPHVTRWKNLSRGSV